MDVHLWEGPQIFLSNGLPMVIFQHSRVIQPGVVGVFDGYLEPNRSTRDVRIRRTKSVCGGVPGMELTLCASMGCMNCLA